jgi:hypothetical protein
MGVDHLAVIFLVCHGEILPVPADTVKGYIRAPPAPTFLFCYPNSANADLKFKK